MNSSFAWDLPANSGWFLRKGLWAETPGGGLRSAFGMEDLSTKEVTLARRMPGTIAVGSGLRRLPLHIRRHRPSCHLCKLLQQRAEVKCSTCVASINRISRSLVEFLLKSLVAGLVFLTPQMPCGWQAWLCHAFGGERACAGWGGLPKGCAGRGLFQFGHRGTGTPQTPHQ